MDFPPPAWPLHTLSSIQSLPIGHLSNLPLPLYQFQTKNKKKYCAVHALLGKFQKLLTLSSAQESYFHLQYSFHVTLSEVSNNQSNPEKEQTGGITY